MLFAQVPGTCDLAALAVLIPAWQPDHRLVPLVDDLLEAGFGSVLVINDGSHPAADPIFSAVASRPKVMVLRHATNLGKGRALKTGLAYCLKHSEGLFGVVTADADGQHLPKDIQRVGQAFLHSGGRPVLGVRCFSRGVPMRSWLGNLVTRRLFQLLTGARITDTQTGLRALPRSLFVELQALPGERYEYEMTALAHLCRKPYELLQLPIETVYLEANRGSHFHPVWDSFRVYGSLLRSRGTSPSTRGTKARTWTGRLHSRAVR